jgi:hypothetical protein
MKPALPSNRSFGWTFTVVFALIAIAHPWAGALAAITALVTLTRAQWLAPLNRAWMALGAAMHKVVSPVILGAIWFGVFTPAGYVIRRWAKRDAMNRTWDPQAPTYWVDRDPPGPPDGSFRNLF